MTDNLESPAGPAEAPAPAAPRRGGGPKTPDGKLRSRRNALRHGLCSKEVLPDDLAEVVERRTAELVAEFQPRTPYEAFLVRQMALATARLDRCAEMTILDIRRVRRRARLIWDHDRRIAIEDLGAKLAKDPVRVVQALRGCKQGADWLIERLGAAGADRGEHRRLGRRPAPAGARPAGPARGAAPGDAMLPAPGDAEGLCELAAAQVAMLRQDRAAILDELDESERLLALGGMPLEEDAPTARLRKYEASCRRAFHAARAELLRLREPKATASEAAKAEPSHRAPLSGAAIDNLAKRSRVAMAMWAEAPSAPAPVVERPAAAPAPAPSRSASVPAAAPLNRRERRAQAKRDRQADRRAASGR